MTSEPAGSALEGERKRVTVLCADVADFTILAEQLAPEVVHEIINRCFAGITAEGAAPRPALFSCSTRGRPENTISGRRFLDPSETVVVRQAIGRQRL